MILCDEHLARGWGGGGGAGVQERLRFCRAFIGGRSVCRASFSCSVVSEMLVVIDRV